MIIPNGSHGSITEKNGPGIAGRLPPVARQQGRKNLLRRRRRRNPGLLYGKRRCGQNLGGGYKSGRGPLAVLRDAGHKANSRWLGIKPLGFGGGLLRARHRSKSPPPWPSSAQRGKLNPEAPRPFIVAEDGRKSIRGRRWERFSRRCVGQGCAFLREADPFPTESRLQKNSFDRLGNGARCPHTLAGRLPELP